jgi:hypothetical protein
MPRSWRRRKASSFPMMQGPTQPRCPRGLTRTEPRNAASAVARPHIGRQVRLRLNRPRHQREFENTKLTPMPLRWLPLLQIRSRVQGRKIASLGNNRRAAVRTHLLARNLDLSSFSPVTVTGFYLFAMSALERITDSSRTWRQMSDKCQQETHAPQQFNRLLDHLVGAGEQRW